MIICHHVLYGSPGDFGWLADSFQDALKKVLLIFREGNVCSTLSLNSVNWLGPAVFSIIQHRPFSIPPKSIITNLGHVLHQLLPQPNPPITPYVPVPMIA